MEACPTEQQRIKKYITALLSTLMAFAFFIVLTDEHSPILFMLQIYFVVVSIYHWWTDYKMQKRIDIEAILSSQEYNKTFATEQPDS